MLMANSIEGRFPFLDRRVAALAESLPASYKLHVLDEKHVLKRAGAGLLPPSILERKKQPYRAPDAWSFASPEAASWIEEVANPRALDEAGVFAPGPAKLLIDKCKVHAATGWFSNVDNMGVVAVLSTQLVYDQFIRRRPHASVPVNLRTVIDRLGTPAGTL
jgi:asparagine synthase (glutamine-hydrolysing)